MRFYLHAKNMTEKIFADSP